MASDTVPAAVPGPRNDPAGTTTQQAQTGGLTSLFAAVEPARPSFDLNPAHGDDTAGMNQQPGPDMSSADFHGADNTATGDDKSKTGTRQEKSVIRAWMLAGAERWRQGGVARVKHLEWRKAQAASMQVKETRQVSVNRSGGFPGAAPKGNSGGNSGGGKGLSSKSGAGTGPKGSKGPKNSSDGSRNGSTGNSGGAGRGTGGGLGAGGRGGGTGGTGSGAGAGSGGAGGTGRTQKKTPGNGNGSGPGGGKTVDTKHDSRNDRPWKTSTKDTKQTPATGSGKGTGKDTGKQGPAPDTTVKDAKTSPGPGGTGAKGSTGPAGKNTPAPDKTNNDRTGNAKTDGAKHDLRKKPNQQDTTPQNTGTTKTATTDLTKKNTGTGNGTPAPAPGSGKKLNTRESREAGYRDGTRAATATAHVRAYRDGVRDGWSDRTEAANRQKTALDQAHQKRKQELDQKRAKDQTVPEGSRTSADFHPTDQPEPQNGTQPIPVLGVDTTGVHLGDGAGRPAISHGEVRNLKKFERLLRAKCDSMTRVADATKVLKQHADERTKEITKLAEQAKAVKGGEALVSHLAKLQDAATGQASKAEEIYKRALRAAEACKVLLANVEARYGGIYKAVLDSGLIAPADMHFYEDRETAHA
jgi:hypothetical protein